MLKLSHEFTSPNFSSRNDLPISMIVMHYTGMKTAREALERLCAPAAQVSAHYVVDEHGTIYQLVEEKNCAWHAGLSYWRGHKNVNNISIGIEIVNPGHEFGYRPFPEIQMESVASLSLDILSRHKIPAHNIVAHSDVAPMRKEDPGELFDWRLLADKGIGICPVIKTPSQSLRTLSSVQKSLAEYGYDIPQTSILDEPTEKTIIAFQRHFRQADLSGKWDTECDQILTQLTDK